MVATVETDATETETETGATRAALPAATLPRLLIARTKADSRVKRLA
jgi:hypothetical protein